MAIKKKVTYSVSYVAGTDTLTTQLNSLLQDIVTLILSQNTGLQILDTITVGSSRFTGAPLYDTYVSGLNSSDYNNRHYESDVIFIGTNEDNVCLSLGFFDGQLVVAMNMTPKVEKSITDVWSSRYNLSTLAFYATGKASRYFKTTNINRWNYSIPYRIVNNVISFSILYWNTEYSSGYSFINGGGESDGTNLVIFTTDEGNNTSGLGAAIYTWGQIDLYRGLGKSAILAFSFSENLIDNPPAALPLQTSSAANILTADQAVTANSRLEIRQWFSPSNNVQQSTSWAFYTFWHTLTGSNGAGQAAAPDTLNHIETVKTAYKTYGSVTEDTTFMSALAMAYNLPYLTPGQAYIRKMRIPGWNPECKGEIYLLWSPVVSGYQSGDIVEVGSKSYAIITEGAVCWAARVS